MIRKHVEEGISLENVFKKFHAAATGHSYVTLFSLNDMVPQLFIRSFIILTAKIPGLKSIDLVVSSVTFEMFFQI